MHCCEHSFPTSCFIFFCFLTIVENKIFITSTRVQIFKYCFQYYICGKPNVMVTKFIILKNMLIKTFKLITFCVFNILSAASSERTLTHFLRFHSQYEMLLKGYLLILWFCLNTFQNLYCQGSVFYYNYFPYFHQRSFYFSL